MNPRLRRLQADYDLMRAVFSGHPHVSVEPLGGRLPPERYSVEFRLRGLFLDGNRPAYRDVHRAEIVLPRHYPAERPYVVPLAPIFHPNIQEFFCIADYWAAGTTLVDVIARLGDMIQWRIYNCASPLDAIAAEWAVEQESTGLLPIGDVDLGVADFDVEVRTASAPSQPAVVGAVAALPEILEPLAVEGSEPIVLLLSPTPNREIDQAMAGRPTNRASAHQHVEGQWT